ncbi:4Fe-4S dicluster domain-containing protein, partial [uncultured Desulfovibrio sp.]
SARARVPAASLHTAWFAPCPSAERPDAAHDHERCISCGTCRDCSLCLTACPQQAISRTLEADGSATYTSDPARCIGCGICAGVCPCGIWKMQVNSPAA